MASTSFPKYVWGKLWAKYPIWKKKLIVHTTVLWLLLIAHGAFLGWARRYDPDLSSFWGAFGFDVLDTATDCSLLQQQQSAWALAVNILATIITYVSSDVLLALSAPSRRQLDACHAAKRYMEVGVHSFHNIRSTHFDWRRRALWASLTLLVLPFHLLYNSVIIVSQPASESYQIMVPDSIFPFTDRAMVTQSLPGAAATQTPAPLAAVLSSLQQGASAATTTGPGGGIIATGPAATATACVSSGVTAVSVVDLPPKASMQPRMDVDCNEWAVAPCNIGCQQFASKSGISFQDFRQWNPDVSLTTNDECEKFYGGFAYCVGISGNSTLRARDSTGEVLQVNETEVAGSVQLLDTRHPFTNWKSAYATSPYLAWTVNQSIDARNPGEWEGLAAATSDLDNLLSLAYSTDDTQPVWNTLTVDSSDWIKLNLYDCRESFSERYRPNTGTVVMVVSGVSTSESVVGLSYLSYNWTDLIATCPTSFLESTDGGIDLIKKENPPTLPLIFGTFGQRTAYGDAGSKGVSFANSGSVCPASYAQLDTYTPAAQPQVEGCLLKSRTSECRIGVNILFMVILMIGLALKAICMTLALLVLDETPILTVGDCMAEYLERPDQVTKDSSLEWTKQHGWKLVDGSIATYNYLNTLPPSGDESDEAKIKDGAGRWARTWPGRQWRKIWGYETMGQDQPVPQVDVFNNLHTMRQTDSVVWLWFYLSTLGVAFGIFYSINSQDGWIVLPDSGNDLYWMLWPTVLCNLPQLFATIRGFIDTWILTSRSSLEDFASYATERKGLRVSEPKKNTEQYPAYFFGGMNTIVFVTTTGLQTLYAWIISEYAQPQWINPLRPNDPPDYFSPAFLMKIGAQANRSTAGKICFCVLIALFPFLAVHLVNMTQSLVVRVRVLRIADLSTFIPQYVADVLLLRWVAGLGRPEKTARLLPMVPLQMPGPATSSLVIALACHGPAAERAQGGIAERSFKWGVVRRPNARHGTAEVVDEKGASVAHSSAVYFGEPLDEKAAVPEHPRALSPHSQHTANRIHPALPRSLTDPYGSISTPRATSPVTAPSSPLAAATHGRSLSAMSGPSLHRSETASTLDPRAATASPASLDGSLSAAATTAPRGARSTSITRKPVPLGGPSAAADLDLGASAAADSRWFSHLSGDEAAFAVAAAADTERDLEAASPAARTAADAGWYGVQHGGAQQPAGAAAGYYSPTYHPADAAHEAEHPAAAALAAHAAAMHAATTPAPAPHHAEPAAFGVRALGSATPSDDADDGPAHGHCAFSAEAVAELEPGREYTGIRRGEGGLGWAGQVRQLVVRFFRGSGDAARDTMGGLGMGTAVH